MDLKIKNKILSDIFTHSQINRIYQYVDKCPVEKISKSSPYGQTIFYIKEFDYKYNGADDIYDSIEKLIKNEYNEKLNIKAIQFARYNNESNILPNLKFHVDSAFKKPMLTLDIQLKSTINWPIIVEDNEYILKDNEALVFSGTHQIHARPDIKFKKNDFCDMIFCHFEYSEMQDITPEFRIKMIQLAKEKSRK